jgi:hypothetical protein
MENLLWVMGVLGVLVVGMALFGDYLFDYINYLFDCILREKDDE